MKYTQETFGTLRELVEFLNYMEISKENIISIIVEHYDQDYSQSHRKGDEYFVLIYLSEEELE